MQICSKTLPIGYNIQMRKLLSLSLGLVAIVLIITLFLIYTKKPQANLDWNDYQDRVSTTTIASDGTVSISNVRDWTYGSSTVLSKDWTSTRENVSDLTSVWFLLEPFASWNAIGHTFLSFEFKDGTVLSFSIEARMTREQQYSAVQGLFNSYELSYQWGTERDFITRRLLYLDHPVYLFKLSLSPQQQKDVFISMLEETNTLAASPRFYNTLTANCTNLLAENINAHYPHTLPWDPSWYLTGYSDKYLMKQGFISEKNNSVAQTQAAAALEPYKAEILQLATTSPRDFSRQIRALQPNPGE